MIIGKLQEYIHDRSVTINSKRLLEEIKVFIWKNGRAEAQPGYNDDLIMSFAIAMYLRDTSLKFKQQNLDLTKAALSNITNTRTSYNGAYSANNGQKPYTIQINGQDEDLKWLLG